MISEHGNRVNMDSPIVIVHQGIAEHLKLCILKARQFNPLTPIVLIGNEENRSLRDLVPNLTHVIPDDSNSEIQLLQKNYKHRSFLPESFELICIMRWLFIRDFMKQNGITRCLHIDSDVLLFCDVWQAGEPFRNFGMTLSEWGPDDMMGHTCFINDITLLDKFCNMIQECYSNPERSLLLDEIHARKHWISDMTLLKLFYDEHSSSIGNIYEIVNHCAFDNFLASVENGYATNSRLFAKRMKKIVFEHGIPYCWNHSLKTKIQFHSIHFQGKMKYAMKHFYQGKVHWGKIFLERVTLKLRSLFR